MSFDVDLGVAVIEGRGHAGVVRAGAGAHLYVASMASGSPFVWEAAWRYRCESSQPERARTAESRMGLATERHEVVC